MTNHTFLGEIFPSTTSGDTLAVPPTIPLLRLRGGERQVIEPEDCRVQGCIVCSWRLEGLLDHPTTRVLREPASGYITCRSSYCPGCNAVACVCPTAEQEDALAEHAYCLGHEHGTADGPDNRPTAAWLAKAGLDAESYLAGYDDACAGLPVGMPAEPLPERPSAPVLWDECDDGLPF